MPNIGFIFAIGAAVTWGLVYAIDQRILANISPIVLLFIDSVISAIILLPFVSFSDGSLKNVIVSGKASILLILSSVVLAAVANLLIFSSIKLIGSPTASIIEIAYPFFVVLFTFLFFRSVPNIYFFLGGILIFAGSLIIIKFA